MVQFSGKITNSILVHLARQGWDNDRLFELTEIPFEFLRDPSGWINASEVEQFLRSVERAVGEAELLRVVGHSAHELRAWGVLDSVLRMMQRPQDIFAQPHRFISYFISPAPPIGNLQRDEATVSFDLPISNQEYPLVTSYLVAALEGLPQYLGKELAQVRWRQTNVRVHYSESQTSMLAEDDTSLNPKPELVQSMVQGFEWASAQLEERDATILQLQEELSRVRAQAQAQAENGRLPAIADSRPSPEDLLRQIGLARQAVIKLTDYLTRSQQALTFAKNLYRKDPQLNEVLRRIDWENIRTQYPWSHLQAMEALDSAKNLMERTPAGDSAVRVESRAINSIVDDVVDRMRQENPAGLAIKHLSFIEKPIEVAGQKIPMALYQILSAAARDISYRGQIQIVSRVSDKQIEIKISTQRDNRSRRVKSAELPLFQGAEFQGTEETGAGSLEAATSILAEQNGKLDFQTDSSGRAYVAQWPLH